VHGYYGNIGVLIRAYCYVLLNGGEGIRESSKVSVLNSNYLLKRRRDVAGIDLPYSRDVFRKHEFVVSLDRLRQDTGVSARDVSKRMLDYGIHPPTIYFPLIVKEAFMIEPTESLSKRDLDLYADVLRKIVDECYSEPERVRSSPNNTKVGRIDEAYGSRPKTMAPTYRWLGSR
jgi:glycine dehydrogenase subunit 2